MSWQAYVDNLKQYPGVNSGIIAGGNPPQVYAQDGIAASPEELKKLQDFFKGPREASVFIGGQKFIVLRSDDEGLEGKNKAQCLSVRKTNTLLVVALHKAPEDEAGDQGMAQKVAAAATSVADYLKKSNL